MNSVILETKKLCKTFSTGGIQQHVLKNLDLYIYEKDFTVIMGASGGGKSTLLYALSGMDTPSLGGVMFGGMDIAKLNQDRLALFRRHNCGFVFQQIYLVDSMSIMDNVLSSGLLVNRNKQAVLARAKQLLSTVGLDETLWRKLPTQMSGGEAQRVGIVRAIINNPKVLFADEPTGSLNSTTSKSVLDLLTKFNEEGQSIVMVTHDTKSALRGNRILFLRDGRIEGELMLDKYSAGDAGRQAKMAEFLSAMGF